MPDGHRWNGYSHEELYKQIHAGPGPKASHASMERWEGVSAALTEINADLHSGVLNSGATWEGAAADQARAGMNPLAAWADDARTGAEVMKVSAELQADFISKARSDMPPPVKVAAEDPGAILTGLTHLVGGQTDYEKEEKAHSAAEQKAREVMATYASSTTTNTSTLGRFHQPPQLVINVGQVVHTDGPGVVGGGPGFGYGGGSGGAGSGGRGGRGGGRGGRGGPAPRPITTQTSPNRPGPGSTSGTTTTSSAAGSTTTNTRTTTGPGSSTSLGHGGVLGGGGVGRKSEEDRKKNETTHAESAGQHGGGSSGTTVASSAEFAPMASAQQTTSTGAGGGPGAMGGGAAMGGGDTEHRRAVAKMPVPSSFDPFGSMGGARADDEEDATHDSADYLRETDDIYGIGGMISPPVIGES
jgi:hypothetical protein